MSSTLNLVTAATFYPVSIGEGREHLRVTGTDEDDLIESYIKAATLYAENYTEKIWSTQTWDYFLDDFPTTIQIPYLPLQSVTFVKYYDEDNTLTTLVEDTDYRVDLNQGKIEYIDNWPSVYDRSSAVNVRFVCGYASVDNIPEDIKHAIKLILGAYYENRQEEMTSTGPLAMGKLKIGANNILDRHTNFNP